MTGLSNDLEQAVQEGKATLARNSEGELSLPVRKKIWAAMGAKDDAGKARRFKLAMSCAKQVMSIWERAFLDNKGPEQVLQAAQDYLDGELHESDLRNCISDFWTKLDDLIYEGEFLAEINAGFAAASAASIAVTDELFEEDKLEDSTLDEELDPYEWDAGYYASIAYSDSGTSDHTSESVLRRQFWSWYLNDAVPATWSA